MASQTRVTTSFLCDDGERMDVRTTLEPTTRQREIYKRLNTKQKPLKRLVVKGGGIVKNSVKSKCSAQKK